MPFSEVTSCRFRIFFFHFQCYLFCFLVPIWRFYDELVLICCLPCWDLWTFINPKQAYCLITCCIWKCSFYLFTSWSLKFVLNFPCFSDPLVQFHILKIFVLNLCSPCDIHRHIMNRVGLLYDDGNHSRLKLKKSWPFI